MGSGAVIQLQRLTSGVWRTVAPVKVAADGTYRLSARADARGGRRGVQRYRVVLNQTTRVTRAVSADHRHGVTQVPEHLLELLAAPCARPGPTRCCRSSSHSTGEHGPQGRGGVTAQWVDMG